MGHLGPRVVIAGTSSGVGKTTVATGLMAALVRRGLAVSSAKVGPDFIDPGYHALATGRPSRNLDAWICGADAIAPLAGRAAAGGDVLVVEGVMGLFDGASDDGSASTAHVARLLDAPIILVVDGSSMSGSVAALVHGFTTFDPSIRVGAVILNRVASDRHETLLREALAPIGVPVVGVLRRDDAFGWRDRHLGLLPVVEHPESVAASLDRLAAAVTAGSDLDAVLALARSASGIAVADPSPTSPSGRARIAVAAGKAFSFVYPDNLERLVQAGAEIVPFDPLVDRALPEACDALYAGGGFPEVFAPALADNQPMLDDVRRRVAEGLVTWAECGGLLWLADSLDGHAMVGVLATKGRMTTKLSLGYRLAVVRDANPVAPGGHTLRGHEFHYSALDHPGDALELSGRFGGGPGGFASPTLLASYLHLHLGSDPSTAERFVSTATRSSPPTRWAGSDCSFD